MRHALIALQGQASPRGVKGSMMLRKQAATKEAIRMCKTEHIKQALPLLQEPTMLATEVRALHVCCSAATPLAHRNSNGLLQQRTVYLLSTGFRYPVEHASLICYAATTCRHTQCIPEHNPRIVYDFSSRQAAVLWTPIP
jgi:hypothetical protein